MNKIKSMEWKSMKEKVGSGIIKIQFYNECNPVLIDDSYAEKIVIWWDNNAGKFYNSIEIIAFVGGNKKRVKVYNNCKLSEALQYVGENII